MGNVNSFHTDGPYASNISATQGPSKSEKPVSGLIEKIIQKVSDAVGNIFGHKTLDVNKAKSFAAPHTQPSLGAPPNNTDAMKDCATKRTAPDVKVSSQQLKYDEKGHLLPSGVLQQRSIAPQTPLVKPAPLESKPITMTPTPQPKQEVSVGQQLHAFTEKGDTQGFSALLDGLKRTPIEKRREMLLNFLKELDGTGQKLSDHINKSPHAETFKASCRNFLTEVKTEAKDPKAGVFATGGSVQCDANGMSEMDKMCQKGNLSGAKNLLNSLNNTEMYHLLSNRDGKGKTALHHACTSGNLELVQLLKDKISSTGYVDLFAKVDQSGKQPVDLAWGYQAIHGNSTFGQDVAQLFKKR